MKHIIELEHPTVRLESVSQYLGIVHELKRKEETRDNHSDFIFRGQRRDLPLLPRLARLSLKGEIRNIERLIFEEFLRTSLPLVEYRPENDWDTLAQAQHHGLPTRLLDWTQNSLMALWFAVYRNPCTDKKTGRLLPGVVWVGMPKLKDYLFDKKDTELFSNARTLILRPAIGTKRIAAQSGVFTVHHMRKDDSVIPLEEHPRFVKKLNKIVIPGSTFAAIRKQLHIAGINHATVFPDLDGLCDHLTWRYSKLDDE